MTINNNIEEARVGFPNAKLLKEKGFDCVNPPIFYVPKTIHTGSHMYDKNGNTCLEPMPTISIDKGYYYSPTQQVALDWILENFDLLISVIPDNDSQHKLLLRKYTVVIWRFSNGLNVQPNILRLDGTNISYFNKPEEAKEAAIGWVLLS